MTAKMIHCYAIQFISPLGWCAESECACTGHAYNCVTNFVTVTYNGVVFPMPAYNNTNNKALM